MAATVDWQVDLGDGQYVYIHPDAAEELRNNPDTTTKEYPVTVPFWFEDAQFVDGMGNFSTSLKATYGPCTCGNPKCGLKQHIRGGGTRDLVEKKQVTDPRVEGGYYVNPKDEDDVAAFFDGGKKRSSTAGPSGSRKKAKKKQLDTSDTYDAARAAGPLKPGTMKMNTPNEDPLDTVPVQAASGLEGKIVKLRIGHATKDPDGDQKIQFDNTAPPFDQAAAARALKAGLPPPSAAPPAILTISTMGKDGVKFSDLHLPAGTAGLTTGTTIAKAAAAAGGCITVGKLPPITDPSRPACAVCAATDTALHSLANCDCGPAGYACLPCLKQTRMCPNGTHGDPREVGSGPDQGSVRVEVRDDDHLTAFPNDGTIVASWWCPPQECPDQSTGQKYSKDVLTYYPDNAEGRTLFGMHKYAFDHRKLFMYGHSVTNGSFGIVFSTMHLKTQTGTGAHGYDKGFDFSGAFSECRAAGIPFVYGG